MGTFFETQCRFKLSNTFGPYNTGYFKAKKLLTIFYIFYDGSLASHKESVYYKIEVVYYDDDHYHYDNNYYYICDSGSTLITNCTWMNDDIISRHTYRYTHTVMC